MTDHDAAHHRGLAAYHRALGDDASADLCDEYADLVDALHAASTPTERDAAAGALRVFRETWRTIRVALGAAGAGPGGVVVSAPVVTATAEVGEV